jgi:ubiquinone/menaquinone biosynthesis C-methylase UbiE
VEQKELQEKIHRKIYKLPLAKIKSLGTKILEVGTGPGLESLILQHDGFFSVATDIDPNIPSKVLVPMGIDYIARCDTSQLPFKDQTFDVVYSSGLIEHFPDNIIKDMLTEQTRVAKYAYPEVPLLEMRITTPHLWDQGERWFTAEEWVDKIEEMGFTIVETTMREWNSMLGVILRSL